MNAPVMNFDAQSAMGFVTSQRSHIESAVNKEPRPDIQYPRLIPVDTSAHPFAKTVEYYSAYEYGKAGWINGSADDIPLAGTTMAKHQTAVHMAAIGYSYGYEEINVAQMMGMNLANDDAMAARRASEEFTDEIALRGDTAKNFQGLINNSAVTAASAANGSWDTATTDEILEDVNQVILSQASGVNYVTMSDTVLMSPAKLNKLGTTYRANTDTTLLELLMRSNTYTLMTGQPLTVQAVRGLETAGVGSTQRMVAYRRSPEVLKMHIPLPHRFLPVFQSGPLNFMVPGVMRLGGLDIRRPKEVRYADGI